MHATSAPSSSPVMATSVPPLVGPAEGSMERMTGVWARTATGKRDNKRERSGDQRDFMFTSHTECPAPCRSGTTWMPWRQGGLPWRDATVTRRKTLTGLLWISMLVVALLPGCSDQSTSTTPVREPVPAPVPEITQTAGEDTGGSTIVEDTRASTQPKEITIERVTAANPVVVEGRARTFENNVIVRVRDARGGLIVEDFTTANGEMGQHNPFRAELFVTRDP